MKHFSDRLIDAIRKKKSMTCVGLDPQLKSIPEFLRAKSSPADAILAFNKGIIDAVCDIVPIVKLQIAFYELFGADGIRAFQETLQYARKKGLLTIADAKRNDVGHTAQAYSDAFLGPDGFDADALTVTPYLGWDGVKPFVEACKKYGKGIFVLVKTSNPSSGDLQDLHVSDPRDGAEKAHSLPLFELMGHYVESWGADEIGEQGYSSVGAVVGATFPDQARKLRVIMPQTVFLVPGYGAQGGSAEDVKVCLNEDKLGAIVNSSRGIIFAWEKNSSDPKKFADAARAATEAMNQDLAKFL